MIFSSLINSLKQLFTKNQQNPAAVDKPEQSPWANLSLGDRMKLYESFFTGTNFPGRYPPDGGQRILSGFPFPEGYTVVPKDMFPVIRVDGHCFSKFTSQFQKPYDMQIIDAMNAATIELVKTFHAIIGYTQSDEITIVLPANTETFNRKCQKLATIAASTAAVTFYNMLAHFGYEGKLPTFDARVFALPSVDEVANCLIWRERDAIKNSISSVAQNKFFSAKQLVGKNSDQKIAMMREKGYDFWSPYLFIKDVGALKELALGNFKAQFGQGLLMGGGFSVGKNMALSTMSRQTQGLKPHSSTQEYGYLRGAGVAVEWGHTTFTLLGASTPLDATIKGDTVIGSLKEDGYHRTGLELSKKHNVTLSTYAANVRYGFRGLRYGVTALYEELSLPYKGGSRYAGVAADCSVNRSWYSLQAEFSLLNSEPALIASQTFRLHKGWTLNSVFRHYSPKYQSLHSNSMSEGGVQNETGLLTGLVHSGHNLKVSGYADLFMHPEPRYGASAPSNGMDLRMEADWRAGRRDALYATARFKAKQKDCKYTGQLEYCLTGRYRLRWTHEFKDGSEMRTQFFFVRYDFIAEPITNGYALTVSYSRSLFKERLDVNLTAAAFHTESYDCRVSVYESGLRYSYNFISLYGKGGRLALTVKYRMGKNMQLNLKAGGTYYLDRDEISSAQQRIASNHKEDISLQFIAKF